LYIHIYHIILTLYSTCTCGISYSVGHDITCYGGGHYGREHVGVGHAGDGVRDEGGGSKGSSREGVHGGHVHHRDVHGRGIGGVGVEVKGIRYEGVEGEGTGDGGIGHAVGLVDCVGVVFFIVAGSINLAVAVFMAFVLTVAWCIVCVLVVCTLIV